ncbi:MAG TPA: nucleoside hydrolase [Terriglobales bacterium]|nr:nucleoside hydrolase [Terriglobales bacterium]
MTAARYFAILILLASVCSAEPRKIIIDQDGSGPGGSNMQTLLVLIQSRDADVLGITMVSGNQWRDEEVAHTLRLLEIIGRTDIPVFKGAVFPLVRRYEETRLWQQQYGKVAFAGAWDDRWYHDPFVIPDLPEGKPAAKAASEDAAHFMVRMVHQYPRQVTIYEGGPMTNLALATAIDPKFPELAEQLVFMGGSIGPHTKDAEFVNNPRHEFNFWFDPEAAKVVLGASWKRIVCTPTDISIKTRLTPVMVKQIEASGTPLARYVARFYQTGQGGEYMWDELAAAAWLDPTLITRSETRYMSVNIDHGAKYGNTLTWTERDKTSAAGTPVQIQVDLDNEKFNRMFVDLMRAPTPSPK